MTQEFYSILTNDGIISQAECLVSSKDLALTKIAVGDSNGIYYEPLKSQTALKNKKWEGNVSEFARKDGKIYAITHIPANEGGFTIREAGVFNAEGKLIVVAKMPETIKQSSATGALKQLLIEIDISMMDTNVLELLVDPSIVTASTQYVDGKLTEYQKTSEKGNANGYAPLDATSKVPIANLPKQSDYNLFDFKMSDHVITDPSWKLADGSWLNKADYPEAYNYLNGLLTGAVDKTENIVHIPMNTYSKIGAVIVDDNFIASGFSAANYILENSLFSPSNKTWEIVRNFTTDTDITTEQVIFNASGPSTECGALVEVISGVLRLYLGSGSGWNLASVQANIPILANTNYYTKLAFTGTAYKLWLNTTGDFSGNSNYTLTSSTPIYNANLPLKNGMSYVAISTGYFKGTINLAKSYTKVGDEIIWDVNTGKLSSENIVANKSVTYKKASDGRKLVSESQSTLMDYLVKKTNSAWYYQLDTINEKFKLPRASNFFEIINDSTGLADFGEAGLPNIVGEAWSGAALSHDTGCFKVTNQVSRGSGGADYAPSVLNFNASLVNKMYGNSESVQPRANKMVLYFKVK
ncbi:MAG: phage tail protein [Candidatus Gastranaerophilales bacterium]|nr:phage tail protein [Candidatus Gastranaerophilales bacterium]